MEVSYREKEGLNQSRLKKILKSPKEYKENKNSTSDAFAFGSLVDFLLTEKDLSFEDEYYIVKDIKISDNVKAIVERLFNYYEGIKDYPEELAKEASLPVRNTRLILQYAKELDYGQSWKPETLVDKIEKEGSSYFYSLSFAKGKIKISEEDYNKAVICKMATLSDPKLQKYFKDDDQFKNHFKYVLDFKYNGFDCKGELDIVHIDHVNKIIVPIDVKTTGESVLSFKYNFWKYRYDFQASFYTEGIKNDKNLKMLLDEGYKLDLFRFIVIEKELVNKPVLFWTNPEVLNVGKNGGVLKSGKELEGFEQAIERLKWHQEDGRWEFPMEYYLDGCEFELTL